MTKLIFFNKNLIQTFKIKDKVKYILKDKDLIKTFKNKGIKLKQ